jgi:hypothetical protein
MVVDRRSFKTKDYHGGVRETDRLGLVVKSKGDEKMDRVWEDVPKDGSEPTQQR